MCIRSAKGQWFRLCSNVLLNAAIFGCARTRYNDLKANSAKFTKIFYSIIFLSLQQILNCIRDIFICCSLILQHKTLPSQRKPSKSSSREIYVNATAHLVYIFPSLVRRCIAFVMSSRGQRKGCESYNNVPLSAHDRR